jgi:lipopolysaccharide biosynthesis protein
MSKLSLLYTYGFTRAGQQIAFQKFQSLRRTIRDYGWKAGFWKIRNKLASLRAMESNNATAQAPQSSPLPSPLPTNWTPARQYFGSISIPENSYESHYEADEDFSNRKTDIKALAFYLPQFHTFPENDHWWGKGFTEWTNTRKARPQFPSHYQPREPHDDIGYYDLSDWHTLKKQAEMLKRHGIYGLCIYHYWFSGKRLMEKPVDLLLQHPEIDLNFCLCWANENWTRAWDGQQGNVLIAQKHENDDIDYIKDLKRYIMDKRYIRVNGEPLILVYRPGILPNPSKTFRLWRKWALENKIGKIRILVVRGCISTPESAMIEGADGEVEFPPSYTAQPTVLKSTPDGIQILSYRSYVDEIVNGRGFTETYKHPVYRGAMLGWDCTPRRKSFHCWYGFAPESYYQWLSYIIKYTRAHHKPEDRFIFINAWNEWAEGTYLEPDKMFGYTNLNTTSRALFDLPLQADIIPRENYELTRNSPYYDEKWYLKTFQDIAASGMDPLRHFVATGWKEGRSPSEHFPDAVYLFYNPKLKTGNNGPLVTFLHSHLPDQYLTDMIRKFDDLQAEIREKLKIKLIVPRIPESLDDVKDKKIAVHLHCFYADMIPQICEYLSYIPFAFDLFISVPENQQIDLNLREQFRRRLPLLRRCELQICPNRGRDIAPMICTFGKKLLSYDYFCHIHTKKSLHTPAHAKWATFIYEHLFGSQDWMERILHLLATDADTVYPPDFLMMREEPSGWGSNIVFAQKVLEKYGRDVDLEKEFPLIEFPQGSMFWGRTEALKDLLQLPLTYDDFPQEPLGTDGSIAHALERLFFIWHKDRPGCNYQIFRPGEEDMMTRKRYWYKPLGKKSEKKDAAPHQKK